MAKWRIRVRETIEQVVETTGEDEPKMRIRDGYSQGNFTDHDQRFVEVELLEFERVGENYHPRGKGWH